MDCDVFRSCNLISSDIIDMSSIHSIEPHMLLAFMMLRVLVNEAVCLVLAAVTGLCFAAPISLALWSDMNYRSWFLVCKGHHLLFCYAYACLGNYSSQTEFACLGVKKYVHLRWGVFCFFWNVELCMSVCVCIIIIFAFLILSLPTNSQLCHLQPCLCSFC